MSTQVCIGLGSNLGDRRAILDAALAALASTPGVRLLASSRPIETPAVGGPTGQGPFLNGAAVLACSLPPRVLLGHLRGIEAEAGRERVVRWGERTLDLDLLLFGTRVIDEPGLIVPHPRLAARRFVLAPLSEVAPDAIEPRNGLSVRLLLANLDDAPRVVTLAGWPADLAATIGPALPDGWRAIEPTPGGSSERARLAAIPDRLRPILPPPRLSNGWPIPAVFIDDEADPGPEIAAACLASEPFPASSTG